MLFVQYQLLLLLAGLLHKPWPHCGLHTGWTVTDIIGQIKECSAEYTNVGCSLVLAKLRSAHSACHHCLVVTEHKSEWFVKFHVWYDYANMVLETVIHFRLDSSNVAMFWDMMLAAIFSDSVLHSVGWWSRTFQKIIALLQKYTVWLEYFKIIVCGSSPLKDLVLIFSTVRTWRSMFLGIYCVLSC